MNDPEIPEYEVTPEVKDHIEFYKLYFDEWNSDKPYEPSFLFGFQEKIFKFLSRFIDIEMDEKEVLKYLLGTLGLIAAAIFIFALYV